jgi:hypothetical protein
MNLFAKHSRYSRFMIFLIPLFLMFMGMKVPDLSRPHKPAPMRRAVLETPAHNVLQSMAKIQVEPCLAVLPVISLCVTEVYLPEMQVIHLPASLVSPSPFPPRAPPVSSASA